MSTEIFPLWNEFAPSGDNIDKSIARHLVRCLSNERTNSRTSPGSMIRLPPPGALFHTMCSRCTLLRCLDIFAMQKFFGGHDRASFSRGAAAPAALNVRPCALGEPCSTRAVFDVVPRGYSRLYLLFALKSRRISS